MPQFIDLTGKQFTRLTVLKKLHRPGKHIYWDCVCSCGTQRVVCSTNLSSGHTTSCGCLRDEKAKARRLTHGKSYTKVFSIWMAIQQRCLNPKAPCYSRYGGRGINICDRWLRFDNFLEDMGEPSFHDASIDRIDNNGSYEPGNCRWATKKEQARNRRSNNLITFNGETHCLQEWATRLKINHRTLGRRIEKWPLTKAMTQPVRVY